MACASSDRYGDIMTPEINYAEAGPLTGLAGLEPEVLEGIGDDPVQACHTARLLVIQPGEAKNLGVGKARLDESNIRPAAGILRALLALNPAPVGTGRPPGDPRQRRQGSCRAEQGRDAPVG